MTREEAIEFGKRILCIAHPQKDANAYEFTQMAISALERKPCNVYEERGLKADTIIIDEEAQKPCDAVSRDAVKNMLWKAIEDLEDLPSVTQKSGKWIDDDWMEENDHLLTECSVCHEKWNMCENETTTFKFCPNCGADMRGESE